MGKGTIKQSWIIAGWSGFAQYSPEKIEEANSSNEAFREAKSRVGQVVEFFINKKTDLNDEAKIYWIRKVGSRFVVLWCRLVGALVYFLAGKVTALKAEAYC